MGYGLSDVCFRERPLVWLSKLDCYNVQMHLVTLITIDRDDWARKVREAVAAAAERHAGDAYAVVFTDDVERADLVLCLGSAVLRANVDARSRITAALRSGVRIIPIVSALSLFKLEIPEELHAINGAQWEDPSIIAEEILRHLGLTERDRRVFLSYLRREATALAYQLYDELHRRHFSVFLDCFEIDHGEFVQSRIEQGLQHASFVILIYSPSVQTSEWIEKEINFALAQRLGLVALAYPGAEEHLPFHMTPSDRRIQLADGDLASDGRLSAVALEQVALEIEREHADQYRMRRERMVADVNDALGSATTRIGAQSLRYKDVVLRLCPRPPESRDLYLLETDCPGSIENRIAKRGLVAVKGGYRENRELMEWICSGLKEKVAWVEPQALCADPNILERL